MTIASHAEEAGVLVANETQRVGRPRPAHDNVTRWIYASLVLIIAAGLAVRLAAALVDERLLFCDDAYYSFSVSRSLALGKGPVVSGLHKTNGFQPLNTYLNSFWYKLTGGDRVGTIRVIALWTFVLCVMQAFALGVLAQNLVPSGPGRRLFTMLLIAFWMANGQCFKKEFNGLETGLYCLTLTVCMAYYARYSEQLCHGPSVHSCIFGFLLGSAMLARNDACFLIATACLLVLLSRGVTAKSAASAILIGLTATVIVSPWLIANYRNFGHIVPYSGRANSFANMKLVQPNAVSYLRNAKAIGYVILDLPLLCGSCPISFLSSSGSKIAVGALQLVSLAGMAFIFLREFSRRRRPLLGTFRFESLLLLILPIVLGMLPYYSLYSGANWMFRRYFLPSYIVVLSLGAWLFTRRLMLCQGAERVRTIIILALIFALGFLTIVDVFPRKVPIFYRFVAAADAVAGSEAKVGAFQSGMMSYYRDNVLNLDGRVNEAVIHAWAMGRFSEYLREEGLDYIVDSTHHITNALAIPEIKRDFDVLHPVPDSDIEVLVRKTASTGEKLE